VRSSEEQQNIPLDVLSPVQARTVSALTNINKMIDGVYGRLMGRNKAKMGEHMMQVTTIIQIYVKIQSD